MNIIQRINAVKAEVAAVEDLVWNAFKEYLCDEGKELEVGQSMAMYCTVRDDVWVQTRLEDESHAGTYRIPTHYFNAEGEKTI